MLAWEEYKQEAQGQKKTKEGGVVLYRWKCECGHQGETIIHGNSGRDKCPMCYRDHLFIVEVKHIQVNENGRWKSDKSK